MIGQSTVHFISMGLAFASIGILVFFLVQIIPKTTSTLLGLKSGDLHDAETLTPFILVTGITGIVLGFTPTPIYFYDKKKRKVRDVPLGKQ